MRCDGSDGLGCYGRGLAVVARLLVVNRLEAGSVCTSRHVARQPFLSQSTILAVYRTDYLNTFAFLATSVCNCTTLGAMMMLYYQCLVVKRRRKMRVGRDGRWGAGRCRHRRVQSRSAAAVAPHLMTTVTCSSLGQASCGLNHCKTATL
jgi:hypothetical protein